MEYSAENIGAALEQLGVSKQADSFLGSFQRSTAAWSLCTLLLQQEKTGLFASQTLRQKIQLDFTTLLPADRPLLRDTLMRALAASTSAPVTRALARAIAALALRMTEWIDPVADVSGLPSTMDVYAAIADEFSRPVRIFLIPPGQVFPLQTRVQCPCGPRTQEKGSFCLGSCLSLALFFPGCPRCCKVCLCLAQDWFAPFNAPRRLFHRIVGRFHSH